MKFVFPKKLKNSYIKYKLTKETVQIFYILLFVVAVIVEFILVGILSILLNFLDMLKEYDQKQQIKNEENCLIRKKNERIILDN